MKYKLTLLYDYIFPNFIIPNASPVEQTIVNYLYTQYNSGLSDSVFLERDLETDKSPLNMMFDKELYDSWPTSLMHGGTRLKNHCYHQILDVEESSVYLSKMQQKEKKYIYPIKVSPHLKPFIGLPYVGSKLNGQYFWKNMSAEALKDAQTGRAFIFLDWGEENYVTRQQFEYLHKSIEMSGIPKSQIIFAHNSFNSKEIYENWFSENERRLTVLNWPYSFYYNSWHYNDKPYIRMNEQLFKNSKNVMRKNHYLFRTRRARSHRNAILCKLVSDNLLHKGDWSFLDNIPLSILIRDARDHYGFDILDDKVSELYSKFPHRLQSEVDTNFNNVGGWSDLKPEHSAASYFDITTETYTTYDQKSLTEKVCKPLVNFQPFVFAGFPGALSLLREHGFKTFSPFIDESYDDEQDEIKRIQLVYKEIYRLSSMSQEEIHTWYWQMEDILIHNHYHFLNFYKNDSTNINLIKYLFDCTNI